MTENSLLTTYIREIERIPLLTREQEYDLAVKAKHGDMEARAKLIESNSRFVISVAKSYQNRGLPLTDLISEGNVGLITAIDKFEPETGYHFISYAVWWIRQSILKALGDKSRMIRLPMNRNADLMQVQGVKSRLEQEMDNVSLEDIAKACSMTTDQVSEILNYSRDVTSLDAPVSEGEDASFGDFIESTQAGPEEELVGKALVESIDRILGRLNERERDIIIRRYGLHDSKRLSLKEVGDLYGVTKERIRQIEKKVLGSMQADSEMQQLKAYIA